MKKGGYESVLPPKEGSLTLHKLELLTTRKMKMMVKELQAHPLNGEVDYSMKWCHCVIAKE
jgi:hypothetical protein